MYEQPYNPYRNNIDIIKNYFKSPMVLVLGILSIVSMILSAANCKGNHRSCGGYL